MLILILLYVVANKYIDYDNIIDPYWWNLGPVPVRNEGLPRIDIGGIYKLSTNAVALTESSVDYGINPCLYSKLPCESIVLLTIHADAPTGGEDLPVLVGVPSGASTISSGDTTGKTKISVVDSQGSNVTGSNVQGNTQRLAYINKSTGVIRFLEFTNPAASAA